MNIDIGEVALGLTNSGPSMPVTSETAMLPPSLPGEAKCAVNKADAASPGSDWMSESSPFEEPSAEELAEYARMSDEFVASVGGFEALDHLCESLGLKGRS